MALHTSARPFDVVHSEVSKTFGQFRADRADPRAMLRAQYRLIEWYYGNNQLMLAVTLAREWLVSAVTYRLERPIDLGREARQEMEHAITGLERIGSRPGFTVACLNEYGRRIHDEWPDWRELRGLCSALASVRNTLDHAEHQKDAMKLEKIVKKIDTVIIPKLRGLAEAWGII